MLPPTAARLADPHVLERRADDAYRALSLHMLDCPTCRECPPDSDRCGAGMAFYDAWTVTEYAVEAARSL